MLQLQMETNLQDKINKLVAENEALRNEILQNRKKTHRKTENTKKTLAWSWKLFAGKSLHNSFSQWFREFHSKDRKVSADTSANLLTAIVRRFVRVQLVSLLLLLFTLIPSFISIYILFKQNKLIQTQNSLVEASRNSSYGFQLSSVFDEVDKSGGELNKNLIGRVIGLTQSLKPYKILEGDKLSEKTYSPEKTQLLLFLLNANIRKSSLGKIFDSADFSHCDLRNTNLSKKYLEGINLENSNLENAELNSSNLNDANLKGANLKGIQFSNGSAKATIFTDADMQEAKITRTDLTDAILTGANINNAVIQPKK